MKKQKKRQNLIAERIFLEVSYELPDKAAKKIINEVLCDIVKENIEEIRAYQRVGGRLNTSIGVILGLDNHEAVIELRKRAYHKSFDCDYSLECDYFPRSAHLCYTQNFKKCPGYKTPTKLPSHKFLGEVFSSK